MKNYSKNQDSCIQVAIKFLTDNSQNKGGIFAVPASAGSGKTTILTEITRQLIMNKQINANHINIYTYTRAGAQDILQRFDGLKNLDGTLWDNNGFIPFIGTMHSSFMSLIKQMMPILRNLKEPIDKYDFIDLFNKEHTAQKAVEMMSISLTDAEIKGLRDSFHGDSSFLNIYSTKSKIFDITEVNSKTIEYENDKKGRERDSDSGDLMLETIKLLSTLLHVKDDNNRVDNVITDYIGKIVIIDECQDLDFSQICILLLMAKLGLRIMCVGDPIQNLYTFRFSIGNLLFESSTGAGFAKALGIDYKIASTSESLLDNFRSSNNILKLNTHITERVIDNLYDAFRNHIIKEDKHEAMTLLRELETSVDKSNIKSNPELLKSRKVPFINRNSDDKIKFGDGQVSLIHADYVDMKKDKKSKDYKEVINKTELVQEENNFQNYNVIDDYGLIDDNITHLNLPQKRTKDDKEKYLMDGKMTQMFFLNPKYANKKNIKGIGHDDVFNESVIEVFQNAFINVANNRTSALLFGQWPTSKDIINIKNIIQPLIVDRLKRKNPELSEKVKNVKISITKQLNEPLNDSHIFPMYNGLEFTKPCEGVLLSSLCLYAMMGAILNKQIINQQNPQGGYEKSNTYIINNLLNGNESIDNDSYILAYAKDALYNYEIEANKISINDLAFYKDIIISYMTRVYNELAIVLDNIGIQKLPFHIADVFRETQFNGYNYDRASSVFKSFIHVINNTRIYETIDAFDANRLMDMDSGIIFDYISSNNPNIEYNFNNRLKIIQGSIDKSNGIDNTIVNLLLNSAKSINLFTASVIPHFFTTAQDCLKNEAPSINSSVNSNASMKQSLYFRIKKSVLNRLYKYHNDKKPKDILYPIFLKYKKPPNHVDSPNIDTGDSLIISTVHGSKGLEWDHVAYFMNTPQSNNEKNIMNIKNEDDINKYVLTLQSSINQLYVGLSRARQHMDIIYCQSYHAEKIHFEDCVAKTKNKIQALRSPAVHRLMFYAVHSLLEENRRQHACDILPPHNKKTMDTNIILTTSNSEIESSICRNKLSYQSKLSITDVHLNPKPGFQKAYHEAMASIFAYISHLNIELEGQGINDTIGVINKIAEYIVEFYYLLEKKNINDIHNFELELDNHFSQQHLQSLAYTWGITASPKKNRGFEYSSLSGKPERPQGELNTGILWGRMLIENIKNTINCFYGSHLRNNNPLVDPFIQAIKIAREHKYSDIYIEKKIQKKYNLDEWNNPVLLSGSVDLAIKDNGMLYVYDFKGFTVDFENSNIIDDGIIRTSDKAFKQIHGYADIIRNKENINQDNIVTIIIIYMSPRVSEKFIAVNNPIEIEIPDIPDHLIEGEYTYENRSRTVRTVGTKFDDTIMDDMLDLALKVNQFILSPAEKDDYLSCDLSVSENQEMPDSLCYPCDLRNLCGIFGQKLKQKELNKQNGENQ